jgi:hypothetical protein
MYFNNPDIITSKTDVVLGSVSVNEEKLNFLNFMNRTIGFYALHIRRDIEALINEQISHKKALSLTALKIFSRLDMYEKVSPRDEEHLAELMMQSRNYEMWESDIKQRFFQTHFEKVTVETKISVTGVDGFTQEEIEEILEETNLDLILESLSMYLDNGNTPSN